MDGMIDALRSLFFPARGDTREDVPTEVAVAALMVDAAWADGEYAQSERNAVTALLEHMFGLSADAANAVREQGEAAQADAPDIVRFTRVIKTGLSEEERIGVMESLWRVVLADDHRDPHEDALLRHFAPLLAVSDHDSARARQRAMASMQE